MIMRSFLLIMLVLTSLAGAARAEEVLLETPPTAEELLKRFGVEQPGPAPSRSRGLSFDDDEPLSRGLKTAGGTSAGNKTRQQNSVTDPGATGVSVAYPVTFAVNATELTPVAKSYADSMAEALKLAPVLALRIIGHTDATGPDDYNLDLSKRRALAVRDYLVTAHGIAPDRLDVQGEGSHRLFKPEAPADGINRRVEFKPIASSKP